MRIYNQALLLVKAILVIAMILLFQDKLASQTAATGMRGLSSLEITAEMAPGVNLWNTLDAVCWWCDGCSNGMASETVWGHPYTTPEMVQAIADRGFKSLRIPVSWFNHMGASPDYLIDEQWMDRVEEVVNYALDADMYAIINIHHDDLDEDHEGSWLCPTYEKQDVVTDQLVKVWTQIATRFRDYDDYLLFETMNEPREVDSEKEWSGGTAEHREVINAFNLAAVNAIRATGGNNETRFIMLPQVGANPNPALEDMVIPNDDPNTIVSVHAYTPYRFCLADDGTSTWGTAAEVSELETSFGALSDKFVSAGIGVVMGEWGAKDRDNYDQRINYYHRYSDICKQEGITTMAWIYSFNRRTLAWDQPLLEDAIFQAYDSNSIPVEQIVPEITSDTLYVGDSILLSATIIPDSATFQNYYCMSDNPGVITISYDGLLEARSEGSAEISVSSLEKSVIHTFYVLDTVVPIDTVQLNHRFEAEDFEDNSGGMVLGCSDEGGGRSLEYLENGHWCTYQISIDSAGIYDFTARAATRSEGGVIEISIQDSVLNTISIDDDKSNDWDDWYTSEPVEIELEEASYELKLTFTGSSIVLFNLNWFEINYNRPKIIASFPGYADADFDLKVYPNPFVHNLYIDFRLPSLSSVDIEVLDISGRVIRTLLKDANKMPGTYTVSWDGDDAPEGIYFLKCIINNEVITKKFFLKRD